MATSYAWEKNSGSGWVPFDGTPTAANPTEDFDEGTWSVRVTATDPAFGSDVKTINAYVTVSAAPSYTGPLDLVPGAVVAYSNRALSAAKRGTALYTIRRDTDDVTQSFNSDGTTGDAPSASITSFIGGTFNKTGAVIDTTDTIVLTNATGVAVGQLITGTDIPASTYVIDITGAPTIQISQAATGTNAAETLTFTPDGLIDVYVDQGSSGTNLVPVDPTNGARWIASQINGKPGIKNNPIAGSAFTSDTDTLTVVGNGGTVFAVVSRQDGSAILIMSGGDVTTFKIGEYYNVDFDLYADIRAATGTPSGAYASAATQGTGIHILEFVVTTAGVVTILINGVDAGATLADGEATPIGTFTDTPIACLAGIAAESEEFIWWNSEISAGNRLAIRQNIATYYGITL